MLVAGIDSSTQSCKVVVCDAETGRVVRQGRAAHAEGTEVDPEVWWQAFLAAVRDAGGLADVSALSVGGQQHGMVVLDQAGHVIRPALLWNDTRSAQAAQDLTDELGAEVLAARTGIVPVASFTSTKLRWMRDAEPQHAARVAAIALPHDWLSWRLRGYGPAGESPHGPVLDTLETDRSDASGTGYFDAARNEYDRELLRAAFGRDVRLPRVLDPLEVSRDLTAAVADGIPAGIHVAAGAGDNAAAALGLGLAAGDVVVSIGTSGTVFGVSDRPTVDPTGTVAGFADATGKFLPLVATMNAARVLDTIAALLGVDHAELGRLALTSRAGSGGLVLQPYFAGERTPNLPDATASLFGMTLASTTREDLARAAIEGMLCGLADGLDAVRGTGLEARSLTLIGGAAMNPAVQQIAAEVFGLPVTVPQPGEYVARGAARQAASAIKGAWVDWPLEVARALPAAEQPVIREQYAARA